MPEHRNQSGFTLVELLIVIVIFAIVATGIYNVFRVHNLMAAKQEENTIMQQELLSTIVQLSDDIRMCGYDPGSGSFGFDGDATNASGFQCTRQTFGAANSTQIGYRHDTANNEMDMIQANGTWETAAVNIADLTFIYYDMDGNIILNVDNSTAANIRSIEITAEATPSPERAGLDIPNRTMNTRVFCRNMGI